MTKSLWDIKLTAWLHDPAEKCFVLFHDPSGHENGTIKQQLKALHDEIGLDYESKEVKDEIKMSDYLAASADRPQWPRIENEGRYAKWSQVDFVSDPVLIHPLTGDKIKLNNLSEINFKEIKSISNKFYTTILSLGNNSKLKFLALWRFLPENRKKLGGLWSLLPADTRVPDHSIWNHLDLTSAFAGARSLNKHISLLNMAFGPVQSFIAQARSTSDLWAGSHLLSSIVWEGMKVIADEIGLDAFLFPQIRGLAIVDTWLLEKAKEEGLEEPWREAFKEIKAEWINNATDTNPLFAACLPNKFSAIVPTSKVDELIAKIKTNVKEKVLNWTKEALIQLGLENNETALKQVNEQLKEFPQIYYSAIDWCDDISDKSVELQKLMEASKVFTDESEDLFETSYWKTLKNEIVLQGGFTFWKPRSGIVYPAIHALADKSLAVSKSLRDFNQQVYEGFRCTLCGEREWITDKREMLFASPGQRSDSVWEQKTDRKEHLCAICMLKRFWPVIFKNKIRDYLEDEATVARYVISTHTMSLIPTMKQLLNLNTLSEYEKSIKLENLVKNENYPVALPKKFYKMAIKAKKLELCKYIPAYVDKLREEDRLNDVERFYSELQSITGKKPETYYALILMDGDNMGAWLSATEKERRIKYSESWHPAVRYNSEFVENLNNNGSLKEYFDSLKTASPTRHAAISQALNNFSSIIVPTIVEKDYCGKLIYAGGDDVLAMAPTDDVLDIIKSLRMSYSGFGKQAENDEKINMSDDYKQKGFVLSNNRLLQTMGLKATASVGVVIAHHQMPLAYALKCLREAEHTAKSAGRNAFCIRILKRAGGEISFTDNWWNEKECPKEVAEKGFTDETTIGLFETLIKTLAKDEKMSRKVFYALEEWIKLLPQYKVKKCEQKWSEEDWKRSEEMAKAMLSRQFTQHGSIKDLAEKTVSLIWSKAKKENNSTIKNPVKQLEDMLYCAEFFARETRFTDDVMEEEE